MKKRNDIRKTTRRDGKQLSAWACRSSFSPLSLFTLSLLSLFTLTLFLTSCSAIDEDLSDCGTDYTLDYELQLVTNLNTELQTQLTANTDISVASVLRTHLGNIFTDYAHDVDLSFYDTQGDSVRLEHDEHIMDASQHSYTLYIPRQKYMHLAVANIVNNPLVDLAHEKNCHTAMLKQEFTNGTDTISSHTTGLFTARESMEMIEGINQTFNVHLYIANCAAALTIDPRGEDVSSIKVYTTGFATQFNICDSTYTFAEKDPIVEATPIHNDNDTLLCYCSVNFPSREPNNINNGTRVPLYNNKSTRTVIETEEPFVSQPDENSLWEYHVYVTKADGKTTETKLSIRKPLRAGQLMILKCWLANNGAVVTQNPEVGTSVTLDWKGGLSIDY